MLSCVRQFFTMIRTHVSSSYTCLSLRFFCDFVLPSCMFMYFGVNIGHFCVPWFLSVWFCFPGTCWDILWKDCLRNDLFSIAWDVTPQHNQSCGCVLVCAVSSVHSTLRWFSVWTLRTPACIITRSQNVPVSATLHAYTPIRLPLPALPHLFSTKLHVAVWTKSACMEA